MECSSSSSAASSDWQLPPSRLASQQHAAHRAQSRRHQGHEDVQQYNSQWMDLLQGVPGVPPEPQSRARTTDPNLRVAPALSVQGQQKPQPVLQPQCEALHYRRLPASAARAMVASGGGVSEVDGASFRASAHMAAAASVSGSGSGESSILPRWDGETSGSSAGTYRPTTTGSTAAKGLAASPGHGATAQSIDDVAHLVDLQRRVAAQTEGRRAQRAAVPEVASVSAAQFSSSSWTPSCGCPPHCTCCSDTSDDNAAPMSAVVHRKSTQASRVRHSNMQRITSAALRRGAYIDCEVMAAQDMSCCSEASSQTGTTPVRWCSDEGSDDLCSSCRHRCHEHSHHLLQLQVTPDVGVRSPHQLSSEGGVACDGRGRRGDSLCSMCKADARARAAQRHDMAAPFAHQCDPFVEAVRTDALCPDVPPLLYLSSRGVACTAPRGLGDASTRAHRERADRRQAYIQSAAALVPGADGHRHDASDDVGAVARELERYTQSTQTEATVDPETMGVKGTTTALSAEVALPLLQDELASLEARTSAQQQAHINAVTQQMRMYHEEAQRRAQELIDLQVQHRQLLELQHLAHQETRATQPAVARVNCGTSPMEAALTTETDASAQSAVLSPVSQRHAAGTQHSDNALETLALERTEAISWMARLLLSLESEWRSALLQDEAESRDLLLHVVEGPSRSRLLRSQEEILYWRQECAAVAQHTSFLHESRELALSERLARQELAEEAAAARRDLVDNLTRQQYRVAEAAGHSQMKGLKAELAETQSRLSNVTAEHADTLEHARQLRVQLIHALRMPTVTLLDRSMASTKADDGDGGGGGAAAAASAYAYATASTGAENTGALGTRGYTGEGGRRGTADALASSSVPDTGLVPRHTVWSGLEEGLSDLSVHRRFARAHQEALRVTRAQCRTV